MLAVPQEYIGAPCAIRSMNNERYGEGQIIKIDNTALEISVNEGDFMVLLNYRTVVKLVISPLNMQSKIYTGVVYLSTKNFARIEEIKTIDEFEKRGAFRVNTSVNCKISLILAEEEQIELDAKLNSLPQDKKAKLNVLSEAEADILDISLSGIRVSCDAKLEEGQRFSVEFDLQGQTQVMCIRVQRVIKMQSGAVNYGCVFFDFTERQMDNLCKMLFQIQREEKLKRDRSVGLI
jgi:hypothetical protein